MEGITSAPEKSEFTLQAEQIVDGVLRESKSKITPKEIYQAVTDWTTSLLLTSNEYSYKHLLEKGYFCDGVTEFLPYTVASELFEDIYGEWVGLNGQKSQKDPDPRTNMINFQAEFIERFNSRTGATDTSGEEE